MMKRQVWFGTEEYLTWVPAPSSGLVRTLSRRRSNTQLLNGGSMGRTSSAGSRMYSAAWAPTRSDELGDLKAFLDGVHGSGPLYFVDPFSMNTNCLPQWLASPRMASDDGPSFIWRKRPTEGNVGANDWGYPTKGALYNLSASAGSGTGAVLRTNSVTNPRGVTAAGWAAQYGTGGAGSIVSVTNVSDGPTTPLAGQIRSYVRTTYTTAATGGSVGVYNSHSASGLISQPGSGSLYLRSSVAVSGTFRVQFQNGGSPVGSVSVAVSLPANQWTRVSLNNAVSTANYTVVYVWFSSTTPFPVGTVLDATGAMFEKTNTSGQFFDGATPDAVDTDYSWSGVTNASASTATATKAVRTFRFPVPDGYKFIFGAHGSASGTGAVTLNGTPVPLLSVNTNQLTNVAAATPWVEIGITGNGTLLLAGLVGRMVPAGADTVQTGRFPAGEGSSGLMLTGDPNITGYSVPLNSEGITADFREVEAWA